MADGRCTEPAPRWSSWTGARGGSTRYRFEGAAGTSALGDRHRLDGDRLLGLACARRADRIDGGDDVEARDDLAEKRVLRRQTYAVGPADHEELAAVGVRSRVGHRQRADLVPPRPRELVVEAVAGAAAAGAIGIAHLEHEARANPMEPDAVEVVVAGEDDE